MLMTQTEHQHYLAPEFEVVAVEVEQGYFQSNLEDPDENPEMDW